MNSLYRTSSILSSIIEIEKLKNINNFLDYEMDKSILRADRNNSDTILQLNMNNLVNEFQSNFELFPLITNDQIEDVENIIRQSTTYFKCSEYFKDVNYDDLLDLYKIMGKLTVKQIIFHNRLVSLNEVLEYINEMTDLNLVYGVIAITKNNNAVNLFHPARLLNEIYGYNTFNTRTHYDRYKYVSLYIYLLNDEVNKELENYQKPLDTKLETLNVLHLKEYSKSLFQSMLNYRRIQRNDSNTNESNKRGLFDSYSISGYFDNSYVPCSDEFGNIGTDLINPGRSLDTFYSINLNVEKNINATKNNVSEMFMDFVDIFVKDFYFPYYGLFIHKVGHNALYSKLLYYTSLSGNISGSFLSSSDDSSYKDTCTGNNKKLSYEGINSLRHMNCNSMYGSGKDYVPSFYMSLARFYKQFSKLIIKNYKERIKDENLTEKPII